MTTAVDASRTAHKQSKAEKRVKKSLQQQGGVQLENVEKVVLRVAPGSDFVIHKPDVFRLPGSQALLAFGQAQISDNTQGMAHLLQSLEKAPGAEEAVAPPKTVDAEPVSAVNREDITDENIELVMSASNKSRDDAVEALLAKGNDVIEAIMHLDTKA
ncbi:MAG: hypothetical protein KVP17_000374 [Porospora cf. gigantea B]|uniref:uncharacterized protein n=1 Tax=Porospora cf. gigantea B TaxID=2853592 RepID=UPI003571A4C0|nr:MAG: hypothetical protein KVP17_000374 [Porospora cf. gigantea B]